MSDPTRDAAFDLLSAILDRHRTSEEALDALPPMEPRDRAAGHRLAAAVLRRLGTLDAVLEPFLKKKPPVEVRHILRIGAAGVLLLKTPAHAAVATSVELARARKLVPFAGLVNAVLRRVAEAGPGAMAELDSPRLDTPSWLWSSWVNALGGKAARASALVHQSEAPLDISSRAGATVPAGGEKLPTGSVRFSPGTRVADIPGFLSGDHWVQDVAAALPAALLAARAGEHVVDLCAAPGGKTAQLADAGAIVTAVERDAARIPRLRENLTRLRLHAEVVQEDAVSWRPGRKFDAVLLDAPCSATGTIRRHPDVMHLKHPRDIAALAAGQDALLDATAALLRPGGRLVYAVCSLQPEEGILRVAAACARLGLVHAPFSAEELTNIPEARTADGFLRTYPGIWAERGGMDGFFAARLQKP